jgi:16S rRNA (uracil1498-N3)-methyltransferase
VSSIPRFFISPQAINGDTATLPPEAAHHARNVLRLRAGEPVILHDGQGFAYHATLNEMSGKTVSAAVTGRSVVTAEPETRITVAQALPKTSDKIEQVLQHGTEVGAAGFLFFSARRSVARLAEGEKIEKRLLRWHGILQGAAEQSGRGIIPTVEWIKNLLIVVGPEGGLDEQNEVSLLAASGGVSVSLGPRILRTETAALVALTQILFAREPVSPDAASHA